MKTKINKKRNLIISLIFAILSSVVIVVCHKFVADGTLFMTETETSLPGLGIKLFYQIIYLAVLLFLIFSLVAHVALKSDISIFKFEIPWMHYEKKKRNLINAAIMLILLIPAFLALYPGYQSYDAPVVAGSFLEGGGLTTYQPVLHTIFTAACYKLGFLLTADYAAGVTIYALIQEILTIIAFLVVINKMLEWKVPDLMIGVPLLLLILNPLVQLFIFTTTKDTLYGVLTLLWIVYLVDGYRKDKMSIIPTSIVAILMVQLRKQGLYILIITFPLYLLLEWRKKKKKKSIILSFIIPIVVSFIIYGPLFSLLGIGGDRAAEKLSVPIQQIARVLVLEKDTVEEEDLELIYHYMPEESLEGYIPEISDLVKAKFDSAYYNEHKAEFWKVWWKLFKTHKKSYIDSFLYLTVGYFYPDASATNGWGYVDTYKTFQGKEYQPKPILNGYYNYLMSAAKNMLSNTPVLSNLMCIGLPFWLLVVLLFVGLIRKQKAFWIALIPSGLYGATLLLGPVCCCRYVLPLYLCFPILIAVLFVENNKNDRDLVSLT